MKIVYAALLIVYLLGLSWYGGSGDPVEDAELETYIKSMARNSEARGKDSSKAAKYMRALATQDDGNEFVMVNLIRFREKSLYPKDSPWSTESDPMLADARYGEGVIPLLLKRGSLPIFVSSVSGGFINETTHGEWDTVAMVRYRSVRDMLQMMVEMSSTDLADHKWAAIEQTHVFPVKPKISLISLRLIIGIILLLFATSVHYLVNLLKRKNSQAD
ncbi:MAG: hypothetical protein NZ730_05960 [Porticoccaceae bacterium]|nr:hypothetical protein [Porticoccaceae bacterium]